MLMKMRTVLTVGFVAGAVIGGRVTSDPTKQYVRHFWHSAEFCGDYWQQQGYWQGLLGPQGFDLR